MRLLTYPALRHPRVRDCPACSSQRILPGNLGDTPFPCPWLNPPRKLTEMRSRAALMCQYAHHRYLGAVRAFRKRLWLHLFPQEAPFVEYRQVHKPAVLTIESR
jgi:hypothetical protein